MADASFNTLAPAFQLLLDGSAAPIDLAVNIIGIRVTEDLTRPSRFTLNVSDVGRVWTKSNKFKSGREVEVKLGYVSKVESVIKAEVHSWEIDLAVEGPARLVVQGYDRLHRFTRGPKTRTFLNEKDSEIIKKIAQEHGMSVDADDSQALRPFVLQNNVPDFDFILERAALCGFEVRVQAKKLFFKKPAVTRKPVATLTWGENIGRIAHEINTFDQAPRIEARAWDPVNQKLLTAPAKSGDELSKMGGKTVGAKLAKERFGDVQQYLLSPATSLKEIEAEVKAEYNRRAGDFVRIECRVDGDPRIRAGSIVEIEKAGKRLDGVYYVTWAEHSFYTDAGYSTEFRGRRYTMDKGSGAPKDVTPKGLVSAIDGATQAVTKITEGVEKARACFQAAKGAVEKANKTLQDAQRALNNTIAAVKTAVEAVENAVENAKEIADAAFKEAKAYVDIAKDALDDAKAFLLEAANTVGAPPEFKAALESAFAAADSAVNTAKEGLGLAENFLGSGGTLFEKVDELWDKIKEKLGGGSGEGPIPVGSKISPPKIAIVASSEADEKEWFARLEKVALDVLKPGDLLLEKAYGEAANPVVISQRTLVADKASAFTSHAFLYVGDGQVARLTDSGFKLESLKTLGKSGGIKRVIAYRSNNAAQAKSAVDVAQWLGEQAPNYSSGRCFALSARNYAWSAKAKARAAEIAKRETPPTEMMCSEFVAYCYQGLPEALITVDAERLSPFELEDWLNDHDVFTFAGALGQAELSGETPSIDELKTSSAALQEAGAEAKAALETAKESVALCAASVSKASANDAAGADAVAEQAEKKAQEAKDEANAATDSAEAANSPADAPEDDAERGDEAQADAEPEPVADEPVDDEQAGEEAAASEEDEQPAEEAATSGEGEQPDKEAAASEEAEQPDEEAAASEEHEQPDEEPAVDEEAAASEEEAAAAKADEEDPEVPDSAPPEQKSGEAAMPDAPAGDASDPAAKSAVEQDVPAGLDTSAVGGAEEAVADSALPDVEGAAGVVEDQKGLADQVADAAPSVESSDSKGGNSTKVAGAVVGGVAAAGVAAAVAADLASQGGEAAKAGEAAGSLGDAADSSAKKASEAAAGVSDVEGAAKKAAADAGSADVSAETVKKHGGVKMEDIPAAGAVADGKQAAQQAKKKAADAQEVAKDPKKGKMPKVGLQDANDLRSAATKAKSDAARLQYQAENAGEIAKQAATGDAISEGRKLQTDAKQAKYMVENAGDVAKGSVENEVLGEVRKVQSEASSAQYMAENAGDIAKGNATQAVDSELGLRQMQQEAKQAKYMAENAGDVAKGEVENAVTSEVRGAQLEAENELRKVTQVADEPGKMAADVRAAEMDATSRANRIASGDLTEAQRTGGDLKGVKEALGADDLDLDLELPDPPDKGGKS